METNYPVTYVPATPEYVLAVLLERSRQGWGVEASVDSVTLDSPLKTLWEACEFLNGDDMYYSTLGWFDLCWSDWLSDWLDALFSGQLETARDLCTLIAARTTMPQIQLVSLCGKTCQPASVFLAVRYLLAEAGADVRELAPSTSLHEFTRRHTELFLGKISMLGPGSLPDVEIDDGGKLCSEMLHLLCSIPLLIGLLSKTLSPVFLTVVLLIYLVLLLKSWWDEQAPNAWVEFGELRTFRDLSEAIATYGTARIC